MFCQREGFCVLASGMECRRAGGLLKHMTTANRYSSQLSPPIASLRRTRLAVAFTLMTSSGGSVYMSWPVSLVYNTQHDVAVPGWELDCLDRAKMMHVHPRRLLGPLRPNK